MSRKKLEINEDEVRKLAALGCTQEEIGTFVGCSARTIRDRFRAPFERGCAEMRHSLRRWQYEKAKEGNVTMLIWLGKQYLDQRDKNESKVTEEVVTIERIAPKLGLADTA
jgi:AraC-like DNA-binding protein